MSPYVSRFFQVLIALAALCIVLGYGDILFPLINVIVFLYPAYSSILAIESENKEEKLKWLMYWVIYGAFAIFECTANILLYVFPDYHKVKSLFLLWCMAPVDWNGSHIIYTNFIRPFFHKHKPVLEELEEKVTEVIDIVKTEVFPTPEPETVIPSRQKTIRRIKSKIYKKKRTSENLSENG